MYGKISGISSIVQSGESGLYVHGSGGSSNLVIVSKRHCRLHLDIVSNVFEELVGAGEEAVYAQYYVLGGVHGGVDLAHHTVVVLAGLPGESHPHSVS